ncbi:helix-turn-helix transcriptional regulator [Novosphingobium jiangmenense]|uniref:PAS domain-containing protein n=1 Tax=Novosphingobium jiangmenense TaxID=2791981 RepID=A0ABS0HBG7_9SPHN|nr:helix-turn-helix transcriptional regulator [Novosphingobium jiangmenense]MBF9149614.1 hypothetical protein [Novosphingobium jiangmenense]
MIEAELLANFYGAAIDRARLTAALDGVRQRANAVSATFHIFERTPDRLRHRGQSSCSNTPIGADEMALLDELNPRTVALCNPACSAPSVLEDHFLPDSFQPEVRRWQEQLRAFGMGRFLAARITLDSAHEVGVAVHGHVAGDPLDPGTSEFLVNLMPHVREAVGHAVLVEAQRQSQLHMSHALDHLCHAVLTCDATGRITSINASAARLLGQACGTPSMAGLRVGDHVPRSLLARVKGGERVLRWQGSSQLLQVCAMPLGPGASADALSAAIDRSHVQLRSVSGTAWVIALADVEEAPSVEAGDLARSFDITHAEALLLRHLACGGDIGDFAATRGVSIHTARSQLKALMAKTGASRQADLVRMALATPAARFSEGLA